MDKSIAVVGTGNLPDQFQARYGNGKSLWPVPRECSSKCEQCTVRELKTSLACTKHGTGMRNSAVPVASTVREEATAALRLSGYYPVFRDVDASYQNSSRRDVSKEERQRCGNRGMSRALLSEGDAQFAQF